MVNFRMRRFELSPVGTLVLICWLACLLAAADSPNDRQPTDPKSLTSPSSSSARAVRSRTSSTAGESVLQRGRPTENGSSSPPI